MSSIEEQALKKDFQMDFTTPLFSRRNMASLQAASVGASLSRLGDIVTVKSDDYESPFNSDKDEGINTMRRDSESMVGSHFASMVERRPMVSGPSQKAYNNLSAHLGPASVFDDTNTSSLRDKYKSHSNTQLAFNNTINQNNLSTLSQLMMATPFQHNTNTFSNSKSDRQHLDHGLSEFEAMILRSHEPAMINEFDKDEIEVLGQRGIWLNKSESTNWKGDIPLEKYSINVDSQPEIITKRSTQTIEYIQEVSHLFC